VKGFKEATILAWLREAADQAAQLEAVLLAEYEIKRGQWDALWTYVGNQGEKSYPETPERGQFWPATMLDRDSRLRVARGIAKNETLASIEVFQTLKRRGHPNGPRRRFLMAEAALMKPWSKFMGWCLSPAVGAGRRPASRLNRAGSISKWSNSGINTAICQGSNSGWCLVRKLN
jgi:hypothetical protein